jgi:GT2 family glycosyltransferase
MVGSCLVYEAREGIIQYALNNKCDYVLFLDSDMVLPPDALLKMFNILEKTDCQMVSGTAFKRIPPFQPCFYTKVGYDMGKDFTQSKPILESPIEFPSTGLMPVEGIGMACCLINTKVFSLIDAPYFFPLPKLGEDLTFCLKLKQKNVKMIVDLSIDVGHVTTMPVMQEHFRACYEEHKRINKDKPIFEAVT